MVYHIALLIIMILHIFNMVSEPNFVLGIKQKSLASKEDSHVHITVRSHTCLSAGSRLHSISQPPWLTAVSRSSNQASRDLTYQIYAKSQIQALPVETKTTDMLHGLSQPKPKNLASNGSHTHHHAGTIAPRTLTRAAADSRLPT